MRNLLPIALSCLTLLEPLSCMGSEGKYRRTFQQGKAPILSMRFASAGSHLISVSSDGKIVRWDVKTGQRVWQSSLDKRLTDRDFTVSQVMDMDLSPDERTIALSYWRTHIVNEGIAGKDDERLVLLDAQNGHEKQVLIANTAMPRGLQFSPDGKSLIFFGADRTIQLLDLVDNKQVWSTRLKGRGINVAFSPNGNLFAIAMESEAYINPPLPVEIYDTHSKRLVKTIPVARRNVSGLVFLPDSRSLAIVSNDLRGAQIDLWELTAEEPKRSLTDHEGGITAIAFSSDGHLLASGDLRNSRGNVIVRKLGANAAPRVYKFPTGVTSLIFSPDSSLLAVGTGKGQIVLIAP